MVRLNSLSHSYGYETRVADCNMLQPKYAGAYDLGCMLDTRPLITIQTVSAFAEC
jgi:hypothetical protein